jgi:ribosomal protection tetracycline resistance protein
VSERGGGKSAGNGGGEAGPSDGLSIGVLAHIDAGKTSTTEQILFEAGVLSEPGSVDRGTTVTDALEQERRRGITIRAAVTSFRHGDTIVNLVDTPGHPDFIAEIERTLDVLDGAVLVISAVEGVQAQTRVLFRAMVRRKLPFVIFINKIDRLGARSEELLEELRRRLTPLLFPLGEPNNIGTRNAEYKPWREFPVDVREAAVELLADNDESLLELFVEHGSSVDEAVIRSSAVSASKTGAVHPVVFGSAMSGAGVPHLIDAIVTYLPHSPPSTTGPLRGRVFKIERGSGGEKICYARVDDGFLRARDRVKVAGVEQKVTGLSVFDLGSTVPTKEVGAGRITKVWGFDRAKIGDGIGTQHSDLFGGHFARPFLESSVQAVRPQDRIRLYQALGQIAEQDPLIGLRQDASGTETYVSLYGEVQKEVIQETLRSDFGIRSKFSPSTVIYVERVLGTGEALDEAPNPFIATIGLRIEPAAPGSGRMFALEINTGTVPAAFYKAVEEAAMRTLHQGIYGWEVIDCIVTMTHSILHRDWATSTAADHRKLAPLTTMTALKAAATEVQEPIESFLLECPVDTLGEFARIVPEFGEIRTEPVAKGASCTVEGNLRAAKVHDLRALIPSITRGEGFLETEFSHFARVSGAFPTRHRTDSNPLNRADYLRHMGLKVE